MQVWCRPLAIQSTSRNGQLHVAQGQSLLFTHADRQGVDISFTVFFVCVVALLEISAVRQYFLSRSPGGAFFSKYVSCD